MASRKRGFAAMDPAEVARIAAMGGRAAHAKGTAHQFTKGEEAREAGRKGGQAVSRGQAGKAHMAQLGRVGGHLRGVGDRAAPATAPAARDMDRFGEPREHELVRDEVRDEEEE